jgi:hypothetical protein
LHGAARGSGKTDEDEDEDEERGMYMGWKRGKDLVSLSYIIPRFQHASPGSKHLNERNRPPSIRTVEFWYVMTAACTAVWTEVTVPRAEQSLLAQEQESSSGALTSKNA